MHIASKIKYHWLVPTLLLSGYLTVFTSCTGNKTGNIFKEDYLNVDAFQNSLYQQLKPVDTNDPQLGNRLLTDMGLNVIYAYQLSTYHPFWFDRSGLIPAGEMLPKALKALAYDGLDPDDYHLNRIRKIVQKALNNKVGILDSVQDWDAEMTRAYLTAARDLLMGIPGRAPDSLWQIPNDKIFKGAEIFSRIMDTSNHFPGFDSFRPPLPSYYEMRNAVKKWQELNQDSIYMEHKRQLTMDQDSLIARIINKELGLPSRNVHPDSLPSLRARYQQVHDLQITGKKNQATFNCLKQLPEYYIKRLLRNMERMREMPQDLGDNYLWLNLSASKIVLQKKGTIAFSGKIDALEKGKANSSIAALVTGVIFHPGVPVSTQEVAEGIQKQGAAYLKENNIHAYNRQGKDVTGSVTPTSRTEVLVFRRMTGEGSPFGSLQLIISNRQDIIICDTLHQEVSRGALSNATWLRVEDAGGLAAALLNFSGEKIETLQKSNRYRQVTLNHPVPVYMVRLDIDRDAKSGRLIYLKEHH